jgi:hypothetical protein
VSRIFILSAVVVLLSLAGSAFAEIGTMDNPIPIGQAVNLSIGWQLKVLSVVPNADNIIRNENSVNSPPKDGYQFFLARLEIKNIGSDVSQFNDFDLNAVGASLIAYGHEIGGTIPDPIPTNDVFPGGVLTGNTLWEIKSSDASSLVMYHKNVKPYIFFSLTK